MSGAASPIAITDPDDPRLAPYRRLNEPGTRVRQEAAAGTFVVEGKLALSRLLESEYVVRSLLIDDHQVVAAADLVDGVLDSGAPVYVASRAVVAETVGFALHRGVVAEAERAADREVATVLERALARPPAASGMPMLAVLEGLNDHENIGALFRNAAAFGVGGVLLDPTCADPLYRRAVRVSMGHVLHVPFARARSWPGALEEVRAAGFLVAALAPHAQAPGVPSGSLADVGARVTLAGARGVAFLLGAEGPGLGAPARAAADLVVSIPMAGGVDSLNVAVAAAVAFYGVGAG